MAELLPCPFCGAGESRIDHQNMWTGMRNQLVCVHIRHWCEKPSRSHLCITANTEEEAVAEWNKRAAAPPPAGAQQAVAEDAHAAALRLKPDEFYGEFFNSDNWSDSPLSAYRAAWFKCINELRLRGLLAIAAPAAAEEVAPAPDGILRKDTAHQLALIARKYGAPAVGREGLMAAMRDAYLLGQESRTAPVTVQEAVALPDPEIVVDDTGGAWNYATNKTVEGTPYYSADQVRALSSPMATQGPTGVMVDVMAPGKALLAQITGFVESKETPRLDQLNDWAWQVRCLSMAPELATSKSAAVSVGHLAEDGYFIDSREYVEKYGKVPRHAPLFLSSHRHDLTNGALSAQPRQLGSEARIRCRKCGEDITIEFNLASMKSHPPSCCKQTPCMHPGVGPCQRPATPAPEAAPSAKEEEAAMLLATAPEHIWLDLGDDFNGDPATTAFHELGDVTWSEDNASGKGIKYVRVGIEGLTPAGGDR